ncbi:MAG: hypothetical protein ACI857_000437, partial [Arenicella sp.]
HEDWTKMTQTEKGAFCSSCKKEVLDFTESTNEEIKESLNKAIKPCIRVTQKKLDELNFLEWFNHLRLKTQLKYAFLFALLVAQSSLMAQESICHEPQFVAVDSTDELSIDQITNDILYYPLEVEIPYITFIWHPGIIPDSLWQWDFPVGESVITGWSTLPMGGVPMEITCNDLIGDYPIEIAELVGGSLTYEWAPPPEVTFIDLNPAISYGSISWSSPHYGEALETNDLTGDDYRNPKYTEFKQDLKVGFNTFQFEILENQLHFSYEAIVSQEILLKISQDQFGPKPYPNSKTLFSAPLNIEPGNKTIIIPLDEFMNGTYTINIKSGIFEDVGRLIYL